MRKKLKIQFTIVGVENAPQKLCTQMLEKINIPEKIWVHGDSLGGYHISVYFEDDPQAEIDTMCEKIQESFFSDNTLVVGKPCQSKHFKDDDWWNHDQYVGFFNNKHWVIDKEWSSPSSYDYVRGTKICVITKETEGNITTVTWEQE